jgi:putative tryptophan/tyrosine transport system permease protein
MLEGILIEGLIYGIMVLGVFITFRVLDFPDLTVDGSFPLGAAITGSLIILGVNIWIALIVSFIGGALAGCVTAVIHNKLKIPNLLAGILTMTMLYSINIRILQNRANLSLLKHDTLLTWIKGLANSFLTADMAMAIFFGVIVFLIMIMLNIFFRTDLGLTLGAMGSNEQMVITQGVNPEWLKIIGVGLSNGLVALSGAFAAQYLGFADVNLGQGIIISGLASVMIGEFIIRSNKISLLTLRVILGSIAFRAIYVLGRYYGYYINMTPNDLKLITGLLIIVLLAVTKVKKVKKRKKQNGKTG